MEEGLCAFDSDPWLNADTGEVPGPVAFVLASMNASRATVAMQLHVGTTDRGPAEPGAAKATLTLIKIAPSGCWMLEDLMGAKGRSLRRTMESYKFYPS